MISDLNEKRRIIVCVECDDEIEKHGGYINLSIGAVCEDCIKSKRVTDDEDEY